MSSVSLIAAGAATIIVSSITQWYYYQNYGANGLPSSLFCGMGCRFDCGWAEEQAEEVRNGLQERARVLEEELRRRAGVVPDMRPRVGVVLLPFRTRTRGQQEREYERREQVETLERETGESQEPVLRDTDSGWTAVEVQPRPSIDLAADLEERRLRAELEEVTHQRRALAMED